MGAAAIEQGVAPVDGVVLDIGVSSMQLDEPERGFSFQADGPLDMRMSQKGPSAADVVNGTDEEELARILYVLGEERRSRAIARAIVKARAEAPLTTTRALADLVSRVLGGRREDGRHPATRTFQALRIYVNDELGELAKRAERGRALPQARRPPRRRHLPLARGSHREAIFYLARGQGNRHFPAPAGAIVKIQASEFPDC